MQAPHTNDDFVLIRDGKDIPCKGYVEGSTVLTGHNDVKVGDLFRFRNGPVQAVSQVADKPNDQGLTEFQLMTLSRYGAMKGLG